MTLGEDTRGLWGEEFGKGAFGYPLFRYAAGMAEGRFQGICIKRSLERSCFQCFCVEILIFFCWSGLTQIKPRHFYPG